MTTTPTATPATKAVAAKTTKPAKKVAPVKSAPARAAKSPKPKAKPLSKASAKPKTEKADKVKKPKLVRDSFTFPKAEYAVLAELKQRALKLAHPIKKGELVRAGIQAMAGMTDASFLMALKAVPTIKTGRPKKA
jgi:hypothetical protein